MDLGYLTMLFYVVALIFVAAASPHFTTKRRFDYLTQTADVGVFSSGRSDECLVHCLAASRCNLATFDQSLVGESFFLCKNFVHVELALNL